jgi:hypothetical protein
MNCLKIDHSQSENMSGVIPKARENTAEKGGVVFFFQASIVVEEEG